MSDFEKAIEYVLANEGGFVNNENDPGGATNFGITLKTLSRARTNQTVIKEDVEKLTISEAKAIYQRYYWDPAKLEDLNQNVATALLDLVVNIGQFDAIKIAQKAIGLLPDGMMGPKTIEALNTTNVVSAAGNTINMVDFFFKLVTEVLQFRVERCKANPDLLEFLAGWINRDMRLLSLIR